MTAYERTCVEANGLCPLGTDAAGTRCRAVTCGLLTVGARSSSTMQGSNSAVVIADAAMMLDDDKSNMVLRIPGSLMDHSTAPALVQCDTGYRVDSAPSSFSSACADSYRVRCRDGIFEYGVDGASYGTRALACVRHCGLSTEGIASPWFQVFGCVLVDADVWCSSSKCVGQSPAM